MTTTSINLELQHEYEREIICMLIGGNNHKKKSHIMQHTCKEMFTHKLFRDFYDVILKIYNSGNEINVANVCEAISVENQQKLSIELDKEYITNANCDFYIGKLLDAYIKRLVIECKNLEDYKKIEQIKNKYSLKVNVQHVSFGADLIIPDYYVKWETAIKTYYPSIDNKIGSLQGGDFLILAGAPGMGKTCMMLNLLTNMAVNGKKVLLFSLEMSLAQLQNRIISARTGINSDKIRNFTMTDDEVHRYSDYAESREFKSLKIEVSTDFNITVDKIKTCVLQSDADIVFIDYLGLISGDISRGSYEKVSEISRQLKLLALDTNKPFIVLHQLSRAAAERKDKRPQISDLRDSGKIEQDADFICFVYRPAYYGETAMNKQELEFLIAKSRHSAGKAVVRMIYDGNKQKITDPWSVKEERGRQCSLKY